MAFDRDLTDDIERLRLGRVGEVLAAADAWIVGGVARALVARTEPDADIDIAVDGDVEPLLAGLGLPAKRHDRFGTAVVALGDGRHADIARTRTETYASPGALPDVAPAPIEDDLARRDFTVNAIASRSPRRTASSTPSAGADDLAAGVLRVLHPGSFADDPTRAIRAARYCARLGLEPDAGDAAAARGGRPRPRLGRPPRRRAAAARRRAGRAAAGFALLAEWGVVQLPDGRSGAARGGRADADRSAVGGHVDPGVRAMLIAAGQRPGLGAARDLAAARPRVPSEAVAAGERRRPGGPARRPRPRAAPGSSATCASGATSGSRSTATTCSAAGIERGPAIGAGLDGALARKLDGELEAGREAELAAALEIARRSG